MKRQNQFKTNPSMVITEPKTRKMPTHQPQRETVVIAPTIQGNKSFWNLLKEREKLAIAFGIGLFIGLVVLGWWLWPVEYIGASYAHLSPEDKGILIQLSSDLHAYNPDNPHVIDLRTRWPELDELACFVAQNQVVDEDEKIRLVSLAYKINQRGCE